MVWHGRCADVQKNPPLPIINTLNNKAATDDLVMMMMMVMISVKKSPIKLKKWPLNERRLIRAESEDHPFSDERTGAL